MMKKVITSILLTLVICICLPNIVCAMDGVISAGDGFIDAANGTSVIDEGALKETSDYVYNVLFAIAIVLAMAVGMIIGIQFITGSVEQQAKVKETLVPYIIGVFVVFASFTIWKIAVEIGNDVTKVEGSGQTSSSTTIDKGIEDPNLHTRQ